MGIDRKDLKRLAKQRMKEAPIHPMLVTLVYGLVTMGMSFVVSFALIIPTGAMTAMSRMGAMIGPYPSFNFGAFLVPLFMYILMILVSAVLQHGYVAYTLHVADGEESGCLDIFCGFPRVGRVIPMNLALAGFYILWSLAIFVPGMLLLTVLTFVFAAIGSEVLMVIFLIAVYIGIIVALVLVTMRYLLANHVLADDPEIGALDAIRRSRALMKGRSGEGLCLQFSFIGWALPPLAIYFVVVIVGVMMAAAGGDMLAATLAILFAMLVSMLAMIPLMLWLYPYMGTTISLYYRTLSPREAEQGDENVPLPDPDTPWRPGDMQ